MKTARIACFLAALAVSLQVRADGIVVSPEIELPFRADGLVRGPDQYLLVGTDGTSVHASRLSTSGSLLGPATTLFLDPEGSIRSVSAAWNGNTYLIVWVFSHSVPGESYSDSYVLGVQVDAAGTPLGVPIQVAASRTDWLTREGLWISKAVVGANPGEFFVAWSANITYGKSNADLYGVGLDARGTLRGSPTLLVSWLGDPVTGIAANGDAYVLSYYWSRSHGMPTVRSVYAVSTADGILADLQSYPFQPNCAPVAASDGSGFLLAWGTSGPISAIDPGMRLAVISPDGVRHPLWIVGPYQGSPGLAFEGLEYLLVWLESDGVRPLSAYALPVSRDGTSALSAPEPLFPVAAYAVPLLASGGKGSSLMTYGDRGRLVLTDGTAPVITVPGSLAVTASDTAGVVAHYEAAAVDDYAGQVPVSCLPASGTRFAPGTTQVSCMAADEAGNIGMTGFRVSVTYSWTGILPPMKADGTSVFKLGRTIPVKFQLTGASSGIANLSATITVRKVSGGIAGPAAEAESASSASVGNRFRYDPSGNQYVFNLATNGLSAGTYEVQVDLGDGFERRQLFSLRP